MENLNTLTVYGSKISYFTGKLEGYLRYKEIPYRFQAMTSEYFNTIVPDKTGAQQMPAVELADGRWMTDTTPIIDWLESEYVQQSVIPTDPVQAFICRLLEDYADEWLWRPAMHYRWSYRRSQKALSAFIVDELFDEVKAPFFLKCWKISKRQKSNFVDGDGVTEKTRNHVEHSYLHILGMLENILKKRPFLLGDKPSLADIGLFGPMFRHFSLDPTPAEIMRELAPNVFEWVARLWNSKASECKGEWLNGIPADWSPILTEIGETHLQNLNANVEAFKRGQAVYGVSVQGIDYSDLPVSRYRVWCLERLREHFEALSEVARDSTRHILETQNCWEPLWRVEGVRSAYDLEKHAPFAPGLKVYPVGGA